MSTPRQAKACPRCGTMTMVESKVCAICGHEFRSTTEEGRPVLDFNRTQTLTLPPSAARPDRERVPSAEEDFPLFDLEPPHKRLNGPAILMAVLIALLLFSLFWSFVRQM